MTTQLITPNPDIPCRPGWCLQYVRQTYGLAGVHPTATAGWEASPTQHPDQDFPSGCWVPVWFTLADEPAGHVALRAPDGSVYSTSDLTTVPHHHPSLDDLLNYYAYYGRPLTYLGWTEDIENVAVVEGGSINFQSITTPVQEDELSAADVAAIRGDLNTVHEAVIAGDQAVRADLNTVHQTIIRDVGGQLGALRELVSQLATGQGVTIDYAKVEAAAQAGAEQALKNGINVTINGGK